MKLFSFVFAAAAVLALHTAARGQASAAELAQNEANPTNADPPGRPVATERTVRLSGLVKCPEGPLPGAVVHLNGTRVYVVTDEKGGFELAVPESAVANAEVTCSFAGFRDSVHKLKAKASTTIMLDKPTQLPPRDRSAETGWW